MVERIGWVQIDTLQMVQRSQYLALWSRLGAYDTHILDRLAFGDGGIGNDTTATTSGVCSSIGCMPPASSR